jgi:hypothetical protein
LQWVEVDAIRVDARGHLGLANTALEIESGDRLIVFSKRGLGGDPRAVYDQLQSLRPLD